jgi:hypothetical protein
MEFQQEMRNIAAVKVLAREKTLSEMAKRDALGSEAAAKEASQMQLS